MASSSQDAGDAGAPGELEAIFEFLYSCPLALVRMNRDGDVDLSNPAVAKLLMQVVKQPIIENLFEVLAKPAPQLRQLVADFKDPSGPICENLRIDCGERPGGQDPLVLSLTMIQLSPSSVMAVVTDVSKEAAQEAALARSSAAIAEASRQRGMLLDHLQYGLVMVNRDGLLDEEHSKAIEQWFGPPTAGQTLWDYIAARLPDDAGWVQLGWDQLIEDIIPIELALKQLKRRMRLGDTTLCIECQPLPGPSGEANRFLVTLQDITSEVERERLAAEQTELWAIVKALQRDPRWLGQFLKDAEALVASLLRGEGTAAEERRYLHTLKGNTASLGLQRLPALCHHIEDRLATEGPEVRMTPAEQEAVREKWQSQADLIRGMLGPGERSSGGTDDKKVAALCERLRAGASADEALRELESWTLPPLRGRLEQLGTEAVTLAEKLGKAPLQVTVSCGDVRLPPDRFGELLGGLVHLVRNAIDHGLETPEERRAAGKGPAQLVLGARIEDGHLLLTVSDDGRGVNWGRVAEKARSAGLPASRERELAQALFMDGLSTKDGVTEVSGRGVGLSALHMALAALGGTITVRSRPSEGIIGTTFELRVPVDAQPVQGAASRPVVRSLAPTPRRPAPHS